VLTAFAQAFRTPDHAQEAAVPLATWWSTGWVRMSRYRHRLLGRQPVHFGHEGQQRLFGLVNMFSGGALLQLTIFAPRIMPSSRQASSCSCSPWSSHAWKPSEGGPGRHHEDHPVTRYLTVALAVLQGTGLVATARSGSLFSGCTTSGNIVPNQSIFTTITMVTCMTRAP